MTPLVSVAIPAHNGAKHLRPSIESVLAQSFTEFELVLIDDFSRDETWAIAQEYARRDLRVSVVRNSKTLGLVGNFNRCLELAKGRYVCVWHQDDVMLPQNIEHKVALLDANAQVGFVHSNVLLIDDQAQVMSEHWELDSRRDYIVPGREFFLKMIQPGKNYVCCPSVLARRECYEKLGHFRSELYFTCDWEMWMRISLYYDVACLGAPLVHFRRHKDSESFRIEGTNSDVEQELLAKCLVLSDHRHRIPDAGNLKKKIVLGISREELFRARRAFADGKSTDGWSHLRLSMKLHPALLWRPEFAGTLARLMLGPGARRWIKTVLLKQ